MPHDRAERESEVTSNYDFVVFGGEYALQHAILAGLDIFITGGATTQAFVKNEAQNWAIDIVTEMAAKGIHPTENLYVGKFVFENWEREFGIKLPLPNKFVPYIAARKKSSSTSVPATGEITHTIRLSNGTWQSLGYIARQIVLEGSFLDVDCAGVGAELHVLPSHQDGNPKHTIRHSSGSWDIAGDVKGAASLNGNYVAAATTSTLSNDLHSIFVDGDGRLFHSIRFPNGAWQGAGNLSAAISLSKSVLQARCACESTGVHVVLTDSDGTAYHCFRDSASGSWSIAGNLSAALALQHKVVSIACAHDGTDLHVVFTMDDGNVYHCIRASNGSWSVVGSITTAAALNGCFNNVACGVNGKELHVISFRDDGEPFHCIRNSGGGWSSGGAVKPILGGVASSKFYRGGCSAVGADMHFTFVSIAN